MYNAFYGFSDKPFEITPDLAFLYLTQTHQAALDTMMDCIKKRRGFISITGEVGTGKTTLVHALLGRLDEKVKTVSILHPPDTFKEFLRVFFSGIRFQYYSEERRGPFESTVRLSITRPPRRRICGSDH